MNLSDGATPEPLVDDVDGTTEVDGIEIDEEIAAEFLLESVEQLAESDENLLILESQPGNEEARGAVFRCFHTIKGLAGFLGFHPVEHLAHAAEDLLDQAQRIPLAGEAIDAVFSATDLLRRQVAEIEASLPSGVWTPASGPEAHALQEHIHQIYERLETQANSPTTATRPENLIPLPGETSSPTTTLPDDEPVSTIGQGEPAQSDAGASRAAPVIDSGTPAPQGWQQVEPEGQIAPTAEAPTPPRNDVAPVSAPQPPGGTPAPAETDASPANARLPDPQDPGPPPSPAEEPRPPAPVAEPSADTNPAPRDGNSKGLQETIRVDASRLDQLVDLVGEIVITESMVQRAAQEVMVSGEGSREWDRHITRLGKIIREVQELSGTLRMVPVHQTFRKMARLARDVSHKADKRVDFQVDGEGTELDKNLVDRIGDPLVHIIRNAIDHGLEPTSAERVAAGKPPVGVVRLSALQQGGAINIRVTDDGRGLDRDAILAKAVDRGVIREGEAISDHEIYNLICESGFSTAATVTEISGRGVGMDVVRKSVEHMGGKLKITSERGVGTTFTMNLPLTLAVIDGMVVRVSGERFILPKLSVVRLVTPEPGDLSTVMNKGEMLTVQGELIPVLRIADVFGLQRTQSTIDLALVAEAEDRRVALVIDEILDQQQLVVKSLGSTNTEGLSGCAIMPDGRVGLVLDVVGLNHLASSRRQSDQVDAQPAAAPRPDQAEPDPALPEGEEMYAAS